MKTAITQNGAYGSLAGSSDQSLPDCSDCSFTTYSSLGYGDVVPLGDLRFLAGLESLIGLVMIAWSASFIYLEMKRFRGKN